jgi:tetratricopeptide (TPR) repeat protein
VYDNLVSLLDDQTADRLRQLWEASGESALSEVWENMRHRRTLVVLDNLDDLQDPDSGELRDEGLVAFLRSVAETPYQPPPRIVTTSQLPLLGLPMDLQVHVREFPVEDGLEARDAIALLRSQDRAQGFAQFSDEQLGLATGRVYGVPYGIAKVGQLLLHDPFYLDDLLETSEPAEDAIQNLVSRVFVTLDEPGRQVVQLLALAGVPLKVEEVPRILDGVADSTVVRKAIRALLRARGLRYRAGDGTVDLHPVEVDWVTHHLLEHDPRVQVTIDMRLADWYRGQRKPESQRRLLEDVDPQLREFHHRWRAGDHDEALVALANAADFLSRHLEIAPVRAAVKAADEVELGPHGLVARELCRFEYEFFAGSSAGAEAAARAAMEAAESARMPDVVAEMQVGIASVLRHRGDSEAAIQMLLAVISADPPAERQIRLEALFELGIAFCYARRWDEALHIADELAETIVPEDRRKIAAGPADIRSLARMGAGDYEGALSATSEAIEIYLDSPNQDNAGYAYNVAGLVWLLRNDLERAAEQFDKGEQLAKDHNVDRLAGICSTNQAWTQLRAGNPQASIESARRGSDLLRQAQAGFAEAPRILHELLSQGTSADPLEALLQAAASARNNPDLYSPSDEMCRAIATTLAASRGA